MTKIDLLARAKALGITGRHDMSKADLEVAVRQREEIQAVQDRQAEMAKELKAETKPRRKGTNLNTPWAPKFYYVSVEAYEAAKTSGALAKAAMQVQLMLKFMVERGITAADQAQQGGAIATVAVSSGFLKTVIEPHVLFAYYRAKMERLGLVFVGYDLDEAEETAEDPEAVAEAADQAALEDEQEDEGE